MEDGSVVKQLDPKSDNLSLISDNPHKVERIGSNKLISGLNICTLAYGCMCAHTLTYTNKCIKKLKISY